MVGPDPGGTWYSSKEHGGKPGRGQRFLTLVFERLRQEDHEIRASLGYKARPYFKKTIWEIRAN